MRVISSYLLLTGLILLVSYLFILGLDYELNQEYKQNLSYSRQAYETNCKDNHSDYCVEWLDRLNQELNREK